RLRLVAAEVAADGERAGAARRRIDFAVGVAERDGVHAVELIARRRREARVLEPRAGAADTVPRRVTRAHLAEAAAARQRLAGRVEAHRDRLARIGLEPARRRAE